MNFLREIYRYFLRLSLKHKLFYQISLIIYRIIVFALKPFTRFDIIYNIVMPLNRYLGFARVLKAGDIAVKAGAVPVINSEIFRMAREVGRSGLVVVIEPDPKAITRFKELVEENNFNCRFVFVNKAVYSKPARVKLHLGGGIGSWNRLEVIPGSETITYGEVEVEMDTVDNILAEAGLLPKDISYISLTINGAEYEALKGMKNLLQQAQSLSVTAIAGRQGDKNLAEINHKPDYVAISEFLSEHEFETKFVRFRADRFGFVIGTKGNKRVFM